MGRWGTIVRPCGEVEGDAEGPRGVTEGKEGLGAQRGVLAGVESWQNLRRGPPKGEDIVE